MLSAEDEEMITKISNMKIDLLTPDASEKVILDRLDENQFICICWF